MVHQLKGMFYQMCFGLISEYNPKIIEKLMNEGKITLKPDTIKDPEQWIDADHLEEIMKELSADAREVIGKNVMPTINAVTKQGWENMPSPIPLFQGHAEIYATNNRGSEEEYIGEVIEAITFDDNDKKVQVKENVHFLEGGHFVRGVYIGTVQVTGVKAIVRAKTEIIEEYKGLETRIHTLSWG